MLTPSKYARLFEQLQAKGLRLINEPQAYRRCHYLPEWQDVLGDAAPRSVWLNADDSNCMEKVAAAVRSLGSKAVVVKDYVKSRKHEWLEACFIPDVSDRANLERVVRRFLELQGEDLNVGLVFREFIEFERIGTHPRSGMPLSKEVRLFFLDGKLLYWADYWGQGAVERPPLEAFEAIADRIDSPFFAMDVAKTRDGRWMVMELGDGQVSGLPESADPMEFYWAIRRQRDLSW
jgi:hypothetical protein